LLSRNAAPHRLRLRAELSQQDYHGDFPGDGLRGDLSLAYESRIRGNGYWAIGVGGEWKDAKEELLAYIGGRLFASMVLPFDTGHYMSLAGTLRYVDFRSEGTAFDRSDWRGFARMGYGIPITGNLFAEGAVSYTYRKIDTNSPLDVRTYRSPGGELRLVLKF